KDCENMFAILTNRQSILAFAQSCNWARLHKQTMLVAAVSAVLLAVSPFGWAESNSTIGVSSSAANREGQTGVSKRESKPTGINFVAADKQNDHLASTQTNVAPTSAQVTGNSAPAPPLSTADYANYIQRDGMPPAVGAGFAPAPVHGLSNVADNSGL